ncbi:MAG: hypothetical protein G01um10148_83 [Parcubacteria group bacterium Gr01-1014_8]|nr:MAG: hypothetical protein G01um10148_83 [Parcubacteria group bacterium Gr01-1014_8]
MTDDGQHKLPKLERYHSAPLDRTVRPAQAPELKHAIRLPLLSAKENFSYVRAFIAQVIGRNKSVAVAVASLEKDGEITKDTAPIFLSELNDAQAYVESRGFTTFREWLAQGTLPEDRQRAAMRIAQINSPKFPRERSVMRRKETSNPMRRTMWKTNSSSKFKLSGYSTPNFSPISSTPLSG